MIAFAPTECLFEKEKEIYHRYLRYILYVLRITLMPFIFKVLNVPYFINCCSSVPTALPTALRSY